MRNYWIVSDTHFNHANILKFSDNVGKPIRPFSSVDEMNEVMIQRWNEVVKPGDYVYHLGDVFFGSKDWFKTNWPRLAGSKRLIVGNHDDIRFMSSGAFFAKILFWKHFENVLMTHAPAHPSTIQEKRFGERSIINVHGHIHQNKSPDGPYRCVCVEHTDYRPINFDEVR